jgi:hypothetical protein
MFSPEIAADRALQAHGWKGGHIVTEGTGLIFADVTADSNLTIAADGNVAISGSSAEAGGHFNLDISFRRAGRHGRPARCRTTFRKHIGAAATPGVTL